MSICEGKTLKFLELFYYHAASYSSTSLFSVHIYSTVIVFNFKFNHISLIHFKTLFQSNILEYVLNLLYRKLLLKR